MSREEILDFVARTTHAEHARHVARIQTLWGGYGEIFRAELDDADVPTVVVKWARPPIEDRGTASDLRKRRSYEVETAFYRTVSTWCDDTCRVPRLRGSWVDDDHWVLVLEDLDAAGFGARQRRLDGRPLDACLAWLAAFHAKFLGPAIDGDLPGDLWPVGTYWHLSTRTDELDRIADRDLRDAAPRIDAILQAAPFPTLVHGDAKEANFCFTRDGRAVAAVDFQYVGGGCAMKDVAYLLYGRADEPAAPGTSPHLATYFRHLREALALREDRVDADAIEAAWRRVYPVARLDFCRFLAGWAPEHWSGDRTGHRFVAEALRDGTLR
jgi:hypothetical protein